MRSFEQTSPAYFSVLSMVTTEYLHMTPMTREDTEALICLELSVKQVPLPTTRLVHAMSGGSPLFAKKFVQALTALGLLSIVDVEVPVLQPGSSRLFHAASAYGTPTAHSSRLSAGITSPYAAAAAGNLPSSRLRFGGALHAQSPLAITFEGKAAQHQASVRPGTSAGIVRVRPQVTGSPSSISSDDSAGSPERVPFSVQQQQQHSLSMSLPPLNTGPHGSEFQNLDGFGFTRHTPTSVKSVARISARGVSQHQVRVERRVICKRVGLGRLQHRICHMNAPASVVLQRL